jgi:hypothetical protein
VSKSKLFVPKWLNSSQNLKVSDFQAEMNDLGQKVDLQQAYRPKSWKSDLEITTISL